MDELDYVAAADLKLLNILLALSGHGDKYACIYFEEEKGLDWGRVRTFGQLMEYNQKYVQAGSKEKDMQKYFNVIHPPLINVQQDLEVLDAVPPPELHMLMGAVNHQVELMWCHLASLGLEEQLWQWCDSKGVTRHGYNGKNKFDRNNADRFLKSCDNLNAEE